MLPPYDDDDAWDPGLRVAWGLGGNQGDVRATLRRTRRQLDQRLGDTEVGGLYRTEPISAIEQPDFFNTVAVTVLPKSWLEGGSPIDDPGVLVRRLVGLAKELERRAGRKVGSGLGDPQSADQRDGPRPLDIDLLFFIGANIADRTLDLPAHDAELGELPDDQWPGPIRVPHSRITERRFVLRPLFDLFGNISVPCPGPSPTPSPGSESSWGPRPRRQTTLLEALERLGETQRIEAIPWYGEIPGGARAQEEKSTKKTR